MSAPITEAHREAAVAIFAIAMKSAHHGAAFREPCAQLIADIEAQACDQLRAEVKLLSEWQQGVIENARAHHAYLKDAIARAERAEAELAAERARLRDLWCEMALEYRDERISYVSVQITRSVWDELDAAMKEAK